MCHLSLNMLYVIWDMLYGFTSMEIILQAVCTEKLSCTLFNLNYGQNKRKRIVTMGTTMSWSLCIFTLEPIYGIILWIHIVILWNDQCMMIYSFYYITLTHFPQMYRFRTLHELFDLEDVYQGQIFWYNILITSHIHFQKCLCYHWPTFIYSK